MSTEKSFAIGCFNFGVKKTPPFEFKGSEYLEELKKTPDHTDILQQLAQNCILCPFQLKTKKARLPKYILPIKY